MDITVVDGGGDDGSAADELAYTDTGGPTYFAYIKDALDREQVRRGSYEQRGIAIVTTSASLVTLLFAVSTLLTKSKAQSLSSHETLALVASLGFFLLAAVGGILTNYSLTGQRKDPWEVWKNDINSAWETPVASVAKRVAIEQTNSVIEAIDANNNRAHILGFSIGCELVAMVLLAFAVFLILT